ncbi:MAG TPA: Gfo/Idh/MocA family oxidoreductase [Kiritimatiellia bacterium]|nr:Gfo/Idh/MocA family oxidoreductase [Kiritimatiellia bacterium]HPS08570.1 Gfo/Idh/MocA family oxidoreductase [Kiritimatiellia bacterium]
MKANCSRRHFIKAGAAGTFLLCSPKTAFTYTANEKIRFALIGIGGMGAKGVNVGLEEQVVAAADVDMQHAANSVQKIKAAAPGATFYTDYRKLFDEQKQLDAVWVATPDHHHFPATVRALEAGLHVYCEKPLCHDVYEARKLRELAKAKQVVTQMGHQGHSGEPVRLLCEWIWQGALGDVTEVHVRPPYNQMDYGSRDAGQPAQPPASLDWNLWQGRVKEREFRSGIHPSKWRGWLDYGTGLLGDWFCHNADGAVWGLKLDEADTCEVECEGEETNATNWAHEVRVSWSFPKRGSMVPCVLRWSSGIYNDYVARPMPATVDPKLVAAAAENPSAYYGTKGMAVSGWWMNSVRLFPETFMKEVGKPKEMLPRVKGGHEKDFLNAIRTGGRSSGDFAYSSRLTEIMLVGNIATRVREKLSYDFRTGRFTNSDRANALLTREPRKGWEFGYV